MESVIRKNTIIPCLYVQQVESSQEVTLSRVIHLSTKQALKIEVLGPVLGARTQTNKMRTQGTKDQWVRQPFIREIPTVTPLDPVTVVSTGNTKADKIIRISTHGAYILVEEMDDT